MKSNWPCALCEKSEILKQHVPANAVFFGNRYSLLFDLGGLPFSLHSVPDLCQYSGGNINSFAEDTYHLPYLLLHPGHQSGYREKERCCRSSNSQIQHVRVITTVSRESSGMPPGVHRPLEQDGHHPTQTADSWNSFDKATEVWLLQINVQLEGSSLPSPQPSRLQGLSTTLVSMWVVTEKSVAISAEWLIIISSPIIKSHYQYPRPIRFPWKNSLLLDTPGRQKYFLFGTPVVPVGAKHWGLGCRYNLYPKR